MKRLIALFFLVSFILLSCGPKPQYKTRAGKKKLKKYNAIQYNDPRIKP